MAIIFIFFDPTSRENSLQDIIRRVENTFSDRRYIQRLSGARKNWLNRPVDEVLQTISGFLSSLLLEYLSKDWTI